MDKRLALELGVHAGDSAYDTLFRIVETAPPELNFHTTLVALAYTQWKAQHAIKLMQEVDPVMAATITTMTELFDKMATRKPKEQTNA